MNESYPIIAEGWRQGHAKDDGKGNLTEFAFKSAYGALEILQAPPGALVNVYTPKGKVERKASELAGMISRDSIVRPIPCEDFAPEDFHMPEPSPEPGYNAQPKERLKLVLKY